MQNKIILLITTKIIKFHLLKVTKEAFITCDIITKLIKQVIKPCDVCQRCKDYNKSYVGETQPIVPREKGELVSMDYYGPLPTSTGGVKFLLVIVDNFTKYVKIYAVKRAITTITVNKLRLYCDEFGKPAAILTDNGTQFTSKRWTDELNKMNITAKFTAIRNPCTNIAERINRQLGNLFRVLVSESHTRWAKYLGVIEMCLNQTYHETIKVTPHEAQLGIKPVQDWKKYIDPEMTSNVPTVNNEENI